MGELRTEGTLGIVFALRQEAAGLRRVLSQSRMTAHRDRLRGLWSVAGIELDCVVSGIGRARCAHATERLIENGARWIISAGFAAALNPEMRVGDVLVADRVLLRGADETEAVTCSRGLADAAPPDGTLGCVIQHGGLITSDTVVCSAAEKRSIGSTTGARALDMESYACARVCCRRGVPFVAVRSISDTVDQDASPALEQLIKTSGVLSRSAFVLARPKLWGSLLKLREQAQLASRNLGDVLGVMVMRIA